MHTINETTLAGSYTRNSSSSSIKSGTVSLHKPNRLVPLHKPNRNPRLVRCRPISSTESPADKTLSSCGPCPPGPKWEHHVRPRDLSWPMCGQKSAQSRHRLRTSRSLPRTCAWATSKCREQLHVTSDEIRPEIRDDPCSRSSSDISRLEHIQVVMTQKYVLQVNRRATLARYAAHWAHLTHTQKAAKTGLERELGAEADSVWNDHLRLVACTRRLRGTRRPFFCLIHKSLRNVKSLGREKHEVAEEDSV